MTSIPVERYYAGIGSRQTPPDTLQRMREYAHVLARLGYTLRSGGAEGADTAFKQGTGLYPEAIYLPWAGYNNQEGIVVGSDKFLRNITARHHPAWATLPEGVRALHTRNAAQILGHTQPPILSEFVLCWTPKGLGGGGTGQAIRIARAYNVPVFDLADADNGFEQRVLGQIVDLG